jgi:hypothetical protein
MVDPGPVFDLFRLWEDEDLQFAKLPEGQYEFPALPITLST